MRSTLVGKGVNWLCVNRFRLKILGEEKSKSMERRERRVIIKMYKRGGKEEYN